MKNLRLAVIFSLALALVATAGIVQLAGSPAQAATYCDTVCQQDLATCKTFNPPGMCQVLWEQCLLCCEEH